MKILYRDNPASYLDIAEFISNQGANVEENLHQLWRRIIFNIAISNTDDHLRNHGFILTKEGWILPGLRS
jgi:serine/threonine-protein kinase HipA